MPILAIMISDDWYEALQKLAAQMDLTTAECHEWILASHLAYDDLDMEGIEQGLLDAKEGRLIPHEEVMAWAESLIAGARLPKSPPMSLPESRVKLAS